MRLRPRGQCLDFAKAFFPLLNVYLPNGRCSFQDKLRQAKILVSDVCQTTFLYALALNIPTIIFWSKETTRLRVTAKPFFDELERVGIYHDSPKSAANMLKKIVDEPCQWWFQPEVQAARDMFCANFIKTSETWPEDWVSELLKRREGFQSEN